MKIDLILDIIQLPSEKPVVLDKEEFNYFVEMKIISAELEDQIYKISKKIINKIEPEK